MGVTPRGSPFHFFSHNAWILHGIITDEARDEYEVPA
jgi:hypothetical protein